MRVVQVLTTLSYGDAVGNDVLALDDTLKRAGYETGIYAENIGKRVDTSIVSYINKLPKLKKDDVIIYHLSTGTDLNYKLPELTGRKIMVYHNITPYKFFSGYSHTAWELCKSGIDGAKYLSDKMDYCLAVSKFNKQDLRNMGYKCAIDVRPILIPFDDYKKIPNQNVMKKYKGDGYTNILFTGRIAPNKCQEDVIAAFYQYHKNYNSKSRLILVGNYEGMETYYSRLVKYVEQLGLAGDVIFTGHIGFDEILAYYQVADLFLCMSEHEGFCVPLVEAMFFDKPIVAYESSAIPDTLNGSGFLVQKKNALETAGVMNYILNNAEIRDSIIANQRNRLKDFSHDRIEKQFLQYLENFIGE